jgi:3-oxoacyl-[acyl-carrier-protein] synthase II
MRAGSIVAVGGRGKRAPVDAIVITGMGAASGLGTGIGAHRAALWEGRDGVRPIERFDTRAMSTHLGATWPGWDGRKQPEPRGDFDLFATAERFPVHELALVAAREAWAEAQVQVDRRRVALVFGTCYGQGYAEFSVVAERIARGLEIMGPCLTISTACSSSTNAIGLARDLILNGHADVVVAGGADALLREPFAGFSALGVLSREPCAPFSDPPGTTLGEGAGFLVLERATDAARRGRPTWGFICGYGLSADAYHETSPDPSGDGIARAIRGALTDAGWLARDVDFVSAHATGTANNDHVECSVIERELGAERSVAVMGSKGHLGHAQGAAGALELILALLCHREGHVPPTLHFRGARPGCPSDPVASSRPRAMVVSRGLKLTAAFGGANAVLAYGCGETPAGAARTPSPVVVDGVGLSCSAGTFRSSDLIELPQKRSAGSSTDADLHDFGVDPRRLDRSGRWLTAAAASALQDGRERVSGDRVGLFVAATRMPAQSSRRCVESICHRGIAGTSGSAFARMSMNAPAGACAQALGLLGPTSTLSIGQGSGLLALALAAEWLTWRDEAELMVAGSVSEARAGSPDEAEGAVCIALRRTRSAGESAVSLTAWAISGPGDAHEAVSRAMMDRSSVDGILVDAEAPIVSALRQRVRRGSQLGVIEASAVWGPSEALRSSMIAGLAVAQIQAGHASSILVVASGGASTVAVLLERNQP